MCVVSHDCGCLDGGRDGGGGMQDKAKGFDRMTGDAGALI